MDVLDRGLFVFCPRAVGACWISRMSGYWLGSQPSRSVADAFLADYP